MTGLAPILVGVALDERDGGPIALGRALAGLTGGPLALVHAYPYEPLSRPTPEYEAVLREQAEAGLAELAAGLGGEPDVSVHAIRGASAAKGLQEAAELLGAAVVVVGSTHRGTVGHVLPGGVGERLLHGGPCPVAIAPRDHTNRTGGLARIGVAFDAGTEARAALDVAIGLARATGAKLSTYTVTEPIETAPATVMPGWAVPAGYDVARREHAETVAQHARDLVPAELLEGVHLLTGHIGQQLTEVSSELDLLVCGSRGYGPLRAVLVGGVSITLAHTAACPLLVVPRAAHRMFPPP